MIVVQANDSLSNPLSNEHRIFDPFGATRIREHETYRGNLSKSEINMVTELRKNWADKTSQTMNESMQLVQNMQFSRLHAFWERHYVHFPSFYVVMFDSRNTEISVLPRCSNCIYLDFRGVVWSYAMISPDDKGYRYLRAGDLQFDNYKMRRVVSPTPEFHDVVCYKAYVPWYTKDFALPGGRKGTVVDGVPGPASFYDFTKVRRTKQKKRQQDFQQDKRKFSASQDLSSLSWFINSTDCDQKTDVVPTHPDELIDLYNRDVSFLERPLHYRDFRMVKTDFVPAEHSVLPPRVYTHPWSEAPSVVKSSVDDKIGEYPPSTDHMIYDRVLPSHRIRMTASSKERFRNKTYEEMDVNSGETWNPKGYVQTANGKVSLVSQDRIEREPVQILSGPRHFPI